jgi:Ger(x)C family germination protein
MFMLVGGEKVKLMSVEDLDISEGIGVGINKSGEGNITYRVSTSSNEYKSDQSIESVLNTGIANTLGKTREERQKKIGKKFFLGLSKLYLLDEGYVEFGIRALVDINFKNAVFNDNSFLVVCKGKNEEYFKYDSPGYDNAADYISDIIKNSVSYNFFKKNYTFKDVALSLDAEGKNIVSPYIEIKEDGIKVTGMALLKKDKLSVILDMKDTKTMNMLRENNVNGILTIQREPGKYIDYQTKSKRKVTCKRVGDKYTFIIDLKLEGEIINNVLYKDMAKKTTVIKKFEEDMEKQVKAMCLEFLDKMKHEYKVDCLQLGWVAAAKYGRDTGVDWDEVVSNSDITVNVKVKVDRLGRGQF